MPQIISQRLADLRHEREAVLARALATHDQLPRTPIDVAEFEAHERQGVHAFMFKGRMVVAPHLTQARKVVDRGSRAGL